MTSLSPITCPYHFDRWSATTMQRSRHHLDAADAPLENHAGQQPSATQSSRNALQVGMWNRGSSRKITSPICWRSSGTDSQASVESRVMPRDDAVDRLREEDQRRIQHADVAAASRQRRQRQHRQRHGRHLDEREHRDRRQQEEIAAGRTRSCRRTSTWMITSSTAGTQVTSSEQREQDGELAEDVHRRASAASTGKSAARWRADRWR